MNDEGFQKTEYGFWGGMIVLSVLACLLGMIGFKANSLSLVAAAAQSAAGACLLADAGNRIRSMSVQLAGTSMGGLDKQLSVGSILLIVLIFVIGAELGILSIKSVFNPTEFNSTIMTLANLVFLLLAKEAMFQFLRRLGKQAGTEEFIANARRRRSDIYSSIVVVAGVVLSMLAHAAGSTVYSYVDALTGLIVAFLIGKIAYSLIGKSVSTTAVKILHEEETADFVQTVQKIHGVITVDDLNAREHGHYVVINVTISVNPRLSVWEGHEVSKKIKQQLMKQYHHVTHVFTHVNPYDAGYPYKQQADVEASELPAVLH
ncbi:cation diffusion facilitator family transporter [Paenibacillus qinlingensis]|uniref:Cation diffusion facilitator family transporter n=1 Tax=Paenibacillus qinlingensis TaxID=1837343 RepID=A0ABU1P784_9BACL|nr:cation diffusion facilitator family transporter [Paenibacillus qinlingensis]MDR6555548.1 cation diffusion facilitator family transporter [Paenibacillus qinlingensis]